MQTRRIQNSILCATLLALVHCSGDGTGTGGRGDTSTDFRVISSIPDNDSFGIPQDRTVQINFSEPVNRGSVAANVTVTEGMGGNIQDILTQGTLTYSNSDTTLIFQLRRDFSRDADYRVQMSTGLTSVTGRRLRRSTHLSFSTGLSSGGHRHPGPPRVYDHEMYQGDFNADVFVDAGVRVEFDEDVINVTGTIRHCGSPEISHFCSPPMQIIPHASLEDPRVWLLEPRDGGAGIIDDVCYGQVPGSRIILNINAQDTDLEDLDGRDRERTLDVYPGSGFTCN